MLVQDGRGGREGVGVELLEGELLVAAQDLHLEALGAAHLAVLLRRRQLLPLRLPVRGQLQSGYLEWRGINFNSSCIKDSVHHEMNNL